MTEKKRPSVAEILAAARKQASGEAEAKPADAPAPPEPAAAPEPAAESSAAPAPAKPAGAPGERPNVKDILAAARAGKAGGAAPAAKPAAEKPAAKPAAAASPTDKPTAEKPKPAAKPAGAAPARDTGSILAAARAASKPGPITKAEAAAKAKPEAESAKGKPTAAPPMPPKPAAALPKPAKAAAVEERRGFFQLMLGSFLALGFTSLSLTSALWGLGTARFMFPNILTEPPSRFKVGFPADFAPGQVETKFVAQFGVWVVNTEYQGQGQIVALRTVCTHLGCTPNWLEAEQKYKCPCHGSGFYKDGVNFEGPAPRPLERYAIRLADDGQIEVDKTVLFQEELGQWNDPACFIPV